MNKAILGKDLAKGQRPQVVVPSEVWFAQKIEEGEKGGKKEVEGKSVLYVQVPLPEHK